MDKYEIDHINSVRDDNRIENLRSVTTAENRKYATAKRTDNIRSISHKLRRNIKANIYKWWNRNILYHF